MLITLKKAEHPSHSTTSSAYDYYIPSSQGRMQSLIGMTNSFGASHSLLFVLQMQTVQFPIVPVWWTFLESAVEPDGIRLCGKWKKMDVHILVFIYSNTSALAFLLFRFPFHLILAVHCPVIKCQHQVFYIRHSSNVDLKNLRFCEEQLSVLLSCLIV